MWGHYADGERGICVEIDARHLLSSEQRRRIVLLPVTYVPSVRFHGFDELSEMVKGGQETTAIRIGKQRHSLPCLAPRVLRLETNRP